MVFKKNLTPIGGKRGRVITNRGKGSTVQRLAPGQPENVTGGSPIGRMLNRYPAVPQPVPNAGPPAPMPAGAGPQPTAAMPPVGPPDEAA
jgi:hypothetical protein